MSAPTPNRDRRQLPPATFADRERFESALARFEPMNSRSGDRVPAGVSGEVGRGTVGTDAPTTPIEPVGLWLFSRAVWAFAAAYAAGGLVLVWLAISLFPWGLVLLALAALVFCAAALCGVIAFGISRLEEDERRASISEVVRNTHPIASIYELPENLDGGPQSIELRTVAQSDLLAGVARRALPDDVVLPLEPRLDRGEDFGSAGVTDAHGDTVPADDK